MQLTNVLLPEPFGPIRPTRSPALIEQIDPVERDEAAEALAEIVDAAAARSCRARVNGRVHQPDDAVRRGDDEADQQEPDDQQIEGRRDRHARDLLQRADSSTAPTTGPTQLVVPPTIGMAMALMP